MPNLLSISHSIVVRTGLEPVTFRQFPTERSTNSSTWPTGKTDGYVYHLWLEFVFTIFPFFFWEISSYSTVNLVLNQTILSFKAKKLLTTYLFPLIFLNYKKQTHKLNPQKTTRAGDWIRTNVTFRFLITNQVQSTSMRHQPVYIITSATLGEPQFPRCLRR